MENDRKQDMTKDLTSQYDQTLNMYFNNQEDHREVNKGKTRFHSDFTNDAIGELDTTI